MQLLNIDQMAVAEASKELAEILGKINQLREKRIEADDILAPVRIKAPLSGFLHELAVHTNGGVVAAGEVLMMLVPEFAQLNVELRVGPQEVDSLHVGDRALVRIVGLNYVTTPDLEATVEMIGADLVQDKTNHATYYPVRVRFVAGELQRLSDIRLVPGMPVDAFVTTSTRTFLTDLWEPIRDRMARAVREK
ncbi:HlyD family efflux transporter periplasmic adaptor subunit [Rhizobium mongolense]|uniref:HlyD family efflux transporter periplasmic adaptor subunit n=1 Tax=Rhizobium mongolense TaxID=57676 RepID=UPI001ABEEAA0|nr:HlyD family efflux transporter periplasmic adaptor subunit [Rhizobium mongolense]